MIYSIMSKRNLRFWLFAGILFVLSLTIRFIYFCSLKEFRIYPDSQEYIDAANKLSYFALDTFRVPFYPACILAARRILPWLSLPEAVFVFQMVVSSIGMVILFYICSRLFQSDGKAFLVAAFCACNITVINWDFLVLSESVSIFLLLLLLLNIILFLDKASKKQIAFSFILCGVLLFTRPFYIAFPAMLFCGFLLFLRLKYKPERRLVWICAAGMVTVYLTLLPYSYMNYTQNGYMGISPVGTINKMGKILQYDMQDLSSNEKIKGWIREEKEVTGERNMEPVAFMRKYGLEKDFYKEAAEFTGEIIRNHPLVYLQKTVRFIVSGEFMGYSVFTDYNVNNYSQPWPSTLFYALNGFCRLNRFEFLFLLLFIECIHTAIKLAARNKDGWMWLFIDGILLYQILMSIVGAHGEYQRLVAPVYLLVFVVFYRNIFALFDGFKNSIIRKFSI